MNPLLVEDQQDQDHDNEDGEAYEQQEEEQEDHYDYKKDDFEQNSADKTDPVCITPNCGRRVSRLFFCYSCHTTFACCSRKCYINPETHRTVTQHYRECIRLEFTQLQQHDQRYPDDITFEYSRPCRRCEKFDDDLNTPFECLYCTASYCSPQCRKEDEKRHEKEECTIKRINQPQPNTLAPSVRSSILVPDLLAHTISFLSLYQWSIAGRVNHAWRNATLQPSAFPHQKEFDQINSPGVGPLHRSCIRSLQCFWSDETPIEVLRDYSHLRSYECKESEAQNYSNQLEQLPATLREISFMSTILTTSLTPLTRFTLLQQLSLRLKSGTKILETFASILQQLAQLHELTLTFSSDAEQDRHPDCVSIKAILDTIAVHLPLLVELNLCSYFHSFCRFLTKPLPQVKRFSLREAQFLETTSDVDIHALAQLSRYLPGVTDLTLASFFSRSLMFTETSHAKTQMQSMRQSIITCIDGFGPHLKSLDLQVTHQFNNNDLDEWSHDCEQFQYSEDEMTQLFARCNQLEQLTFYNFSNRSRTPKQTKMLKELIPLLDSLDISLGDLTEDEISSTAISGMIESLTQWFPNLTSIAFDQPPEPVLSFAPPSSEFTAREDSLPRLKKVLFHSFDVETHIPSLLRLLPPIDLLIIQESRLSAERFFEYAQYRPLAFTKQAKRYINSVIPQIATIEEDDMRWFDAASELVHVDSILAPSSLPAGVHSVYHRGVELSQLQHESSPFGILNGDSGKNDSSSDRGGRGGGRGRYYTRTERRARKSASMTSHRWMFDRIKRCQWNMCAIDDSSTGGSLILSLPESLAYHRSSVWIYTHAHDATRNLELISLAHRFGRFVDERSLRT